MRRNVYQWPGVAGIFLSTQNMSRDVYQGPVWSQVSWGVAGTFLSKKTWGAMCTRDMEGRRYLGVWQIPWGIAGTVISSQKISQKMYQRPGGSQVLLYARKHKALRVPGTWKIKTCDATWTSDLEGRKYLVILQVSFYLLKTSPGTCTRDLGLQVPSYPPQIWAATTYAFTSK